MKTIEPRVIAAAEQKLIDAIAEHISWKSVREAIKQKLNIAMMKDLTVDGGKLIARGNDVVYQIMLGPHAGVSVFLNQAGELVEIDYTGNLEAVREVLARPAEEVVEEKAAAEKVVALSAEISRLILKINTGSGKDHLTDGK